MLTTREHLTTPHFWGYVCVSNISKLLMLNDLTSSDFRFGYFDHLTFNSISAMPDFARKKRYSENSETVILLIVYDYALRSNDMNSFKWWLEYYARPVL